MTETKRLFMFIDGDNLNESYTDRIFEEAEKIGTVLEAHCFCDFIKRKQTWEDAYNRYGTQLHYIPGKGKGRRQNSPDPNTSDIALTVLAMKKLYENPDVDGVIIVANDKDYVPLAKEIREGFHKNAYMFYNQQDDKAVVSYDASVLLTDAQTKTGKAKSAATKKAQTEQQIVKECIEDSMSDGEALLANIGTALKLRQIDYSDTGLGGYLGDMFTKHPKIFSEYRLFTGDKRDRVVRKD